ncbi:MAG: PAS domain-containing protein [Bernardetiaceae bacterium]|nr:PAS domain-containing protein [Bernardetiaceae bacterium]
MFNWNYFKNIRQRIWLAFGSILVVFIIASGGAVFQLNQNTRLLEVSTNVWQPSIDVLGKWQKMSQDLSGLNAYYLHVRNKNMQSGYRDQLRLHVSETYPKLRQQLDRLTKEWDETEYNQVRLADSLKLRTDLLVEMTRGVLDRFQSLSIQEQQNLVYQENIQKELIRIQQLNQLISKDIEQLIAYRKQQVALVQDEIASSLSTLQTRPIFFIPILMLIGFFIVYFSANSIVKPLREIQRSVLNLSRGKITTHRQRYGGRDEISQIGQALQQLQKRIHDITDFTNEIGKRNYQTDFTPASTEDSLGKSLLQMRDNLAMAEKMQNQRQWVDQGLKQISEIIGTYAQAVSLKEYADMLLRKLIFYSQSSQGCLFLLSSEKRENEDSKVPYLELITTYAWGKKRFLDQRIAYGKGIVGQAWKEGGIVKLNDVPKEYIKLSSGLGEAVPTHLLIAPMVVNQQVFGMLEIAKFKPFTEEEELYFKQAGERIGSSLSLLQNSEKNKAMLEQSKEYAEKIASQELKAKESAAQLLATQEEMQNVQEELLARNELIRQSFGLVDLDTQGRITNVNKVIEMWLGFNHNEILGKAFYEFVGDWEEQDNIFANELILSKSKILKREVQMQHKNGYIVPMIVYANAIYDTKDELKHILCILERQK